MGSCTSTAHFSHIPPTHKQTHRNAKSVEPQATYKKPALEDFKGLRVR